MGGRVRFAQLSVGSAAVGGHCLVSGEAGALQVDRNQSAEVLLEVGYIRYVQVEVLEVVRMWRSS